MADISREGHRERVKDAYLNHGLAPMADHNVLEMILFYAIPRKDVKELAYAILNYFGGNLNAVFQATPRELMEVKGVGKNTAILISSYGAVYERMNLRRNDGAKRLSNYLEAKEYITNLLKGLPTERVIMVTLDNSANIINTHILADGSVNQAEFSARLLLANAMKDKATAVLIGHNHPNGDYKPSDSDAKFTQDCSYVLKTIGISLRDHIIVGQNGSLSLANDTRCAYMFD